MSSFLQELWRQHRCDLCDDEEAVNIGESNDPAHIFGIFKKSKNRAFTRTCIVMDIRPFEDWDRFLEGKFYENMSWVDRPEKSDLSVLFECQDGSRIMGVITTTLFRSLPKVTVGDRCTVSGVFEYVKLIKEHDVYLFFRIKDWSI